MKFKKICQDFLLILLLVMVAETDVTVNAAEMNKKTEYESRLSSKQKLYQMYYNKLMELKKQCESGLLAPKNAYESKLLGLRLAKLVDFNHDGTEELLLAHVASINEDGCPEYVLEVWRGNGEEIEKIFEGDYHANFETYISIKLYSYGDQYFIGQSVTGADECASWLGESSALQWISGFVLMGFDGENFVPVHTLFWGYDSDNQERYNLNGECMSLKDMENSKSYEDWLTYTENPEISLFTCGSGGCVLEGTPEELEETFLMLGNTGDSLDEDTPVYEDINVDFHEGVYWSDENRLVIVKDTYYYKVSMLIFRFTTLDSVGHMNGETMFLYDDDREMNSHIDWIDENTCVYTLDDGVFSESGMPAGTNYEFVRSDTETIDDYADFIW